MEITKLRSWKEPSQLFGCCRQPVTGFQVHLAHSMFSLVSLKTAFGVGVGYLRGWSGLPFPGFPNIPWSRSIRERVCETNFPPSRSPHHRPLMKPYQLLSV
jgi:hypothetical protein